MKTFVSHNRKQLSKELKNGSLALFFNGTSPNSTADSVYPFRPNKNFLYLTGIKREEFILSIEKSEDKVQATLFIKKPNFDIEKWVGIYLKKDQALEISGVDEVLFVEDFDTWLNTKIGQGKVSKVYLDMFRQGPDVTPTEALKYADIIGTKYPYIRIKNSAHLMAKQRLIKSEMEIKKMQQAIDMTEAGLKRVLSTIEPGQKEYEAVAEFDYQIAKMGADREAFETIAASGGNAVVLHYVGNDDVMKDGDLVLLDLGAQFDEYSADISRTYPVNGKFTDRQRDVYNTVLSTNEAIISMIKPGVTMAELNAKARELLTEGLKKLGLITEDKDLTKYYYHSIGHSLGLDTHDVGGREITLKEGMVITVEPGLYIAEESMGIRIEDDVLVTKEGFDVLSKHIIKSVEDIEAYMAK